MVLGLLVRVLVVLNKDAPVRHFALSLGVSAIRRIGDLPTDHAGA